jgi:hypothetical protein
VIYYQDDPSPAGLSLSPGFMTFDDPCPECVEEGRCPLCGKETQFSDYDDVDICPSCGWKYPITTDAMNAAEIAPEEPECICPEQHIAVEDWAYFYTEEMEPYRL